MTAFQDQFKSKNVDLLDSLDKNTDSNVSLLDMTDSPIAQSNNQDHMNLLDQNLTQINLNSTQCLKDTLSIFDPLQQPKLTMVPTRLPTPKRPSVYRHPSADHFHKTSLFISQDTSPPVQMDPTPPSSPGKRIRRSSGAKEKLNLSDFDPLVITERKTSPISVLNTTSLPTNRATDLLVLSPVHPSVRDDQANTETIRRPFVDTSTELVSAQGVISQPPMDLLCDSPPRTAHDRLQSLMNREVMTPEYATSRYRHCLSEYEKTEIMQYPHVYFVGPQAKKVMAAVDEAQQNFGYDDEKGDYLIRIKDHLDYRYEIIESLGKGSFGHVLKCRDHKSTASNSFVAVKIIRNKKRFYTQAQTEVKILEQLMKWDPENKHCNVRMLDRFYFREHLCIVFECLSLNLYEILQQNEFQGFSMGLVKRFGYQILMALTLLSEHNVIHCDLKPENILLKQPDRSGIRIIDYGSSCYTHEKVYTYIQSRFYRAPEVILGLEYGLPIDMWSTGCILAELYTGHPIFPGENEQDQLACIMQLLGVPNNQYLDRCTRRKKFFDMYDHPRKAINSKGIKRKPNTLTLSNALKRSTHDKVDPDFVDFVGQCLKWEPSERMKPTEALEHPWIRSMRE